MTISMTGFGRAITENEQLKVKVEMKSVNSRYNDITIKLPKLYTFAEERLKKILKDYVSRGKIDIYISVSTIASSNIKVAIDMDLARQYYDSIMKIKNNFKIREKVRAYNISSIPGVLNAVESEADEDMIYQLLENTFTEALNELVKMKKIEGENIQQDMLSKLNELIDNLNIIKREAPTVVEEYRVKLQSRITDLIGDQGIDESKFNQEVAFFADRACIDEEITRLDSHIDQFESNLILDNTGRKLDFIIQEMNREVNTIGSKANSLTIANCVLECKCIIEKLREQAMNLE
ncbi:MAG: YicC family protein [Clostridia bacterium]|nr:YicC family protein [Clostridia bacterium]